MGIDIYIDLNKPTTQSGTSAMIFKPDRLSLWSQDKQARSAANYLHQPNGGGVEMFGITLANLAAIFAGIRKE